MSGWVSSGRSRGWLAIFMGSARRRQVTLSALLAGTVLAAGLIAIAPVIGFSLTVTFAVVLGVDLSSTAPAPGRRHRAFHGGRIPIAALVSSFR